MVFKHVLILIPSSFFLLLEPMLLLFSSSALVSSPLISVSFFSLCLISSPLLFCPLLCSYFLSSLLFLSQFLSSPLRSPLFQSVRRPCSNCEGGLEGISALQEGKRALGENPSNPAEDLQSKSRQQAMLEHNPPQPCHRHWSRAVELTRGPPSLAALFKSPVKSVEQPSVSLMVLSVCGVPCSALRNALLPGVPSCYEFC